jgi:hypothetical protein
MKQMRPGQQGWTDERSTHRERETEEVRYYKLNSSPHCFPVHPSGHRSFKRHTLFSPSLQTIYIRWKRASRHSSLNNHYIEASFYPFSSNSELNRTEDSKDAYPWFLDLHRRRRSQPDQCCSRSCRSVRTMRWHGLQGRDCLR